MMKNESFADIHTHILPGMDDGASTVEESLMMLSELFRQGVTTVAATPHFYADRESPKDFFERRQEAFSRLEGKLNGDLTVLPGAEVRYYQGISGTTELPELTIGDTNLLLLEMPFGEWTPSVVNEVYSLQRDRKLQVVIAHIDRYFSRNNLKYTEGMRSFGIMFQLNADVFFDRKRKSTALKMLESKAVDFIASDCHNMTSRPPMLTEAYTVMEKKLGSDCKEWLLEQSEAYFRGGDG